MDEYETVSENNDGNQIIICSIDPIQIDDFDKCKKDTDDRNVSKYNKRKRWKCLRCEQIFYSEEEKETHWVNFHSASLITISGDISQSVNDCRIDDRYCHFLCDICGEMSILSLKSYRFALRNPEGLINYVCTKCNKELTNRKMLKEQHIQHEKLKPYLCFICGIQFGNKIKMYRHFSTHKTKSFKCSFCGINFDSPSKVTLHEKTHLRHKIFQFCCRICKQVFSNGRDLEVHLHTHTEDDLKVGLSVIGFGGEKEKNCVMRCKFCGKVFRNCRSLKNHSMQHQNEKSYEGFEEKLKSDSLSKFHENVYKSESSESLQQIISNDEKIFLSNCRICGQEVSNEGNLYQPVENHSEVFQNHRKMRVNFSSASNNCIHYKECNKFLTNIKVLKSQIGDLKPKCEHEENSRTAKWCKSNQIDHEGKRI